MVCENDRVRCRSYVTVRRIRLRSALCRMAHEKPAGRLVDQRGRRSRTLYRKLNKRKCKELTG